MGFWKELRTRWMYWRYRYITRNRQRMAARRAAGNGPRPIYMDSHRGLGPRVSGLRTRTGKAWLLLVVTILLIAIVQQYMQAANVVFVVDIAIIALAYFTWTRVTV